MKPLTKNFTQSLPNASPAESSAQHKPEAEFLPLDEFLQVQVLGRPSLRGAVRSFLADHCNHRKGLSYIAGRGKLIAELAVISEKNMSFGEVVKHAHAALHQSEFKAFRTMDARELARVLSIPAVEMR